MIKPYSALSSGRLANSFKMSLAACNIRALPHSARSASTSALLILGMPVNKIVKHARWAHTKTFVQHYKKDMNMLLRKVKLDFQILWKFLN